MTRIRYTLHKEEPRSLVSNKILAGNDIYVIHISGLDHEAIHVNITNGSGMVVINETFGNIRYAQKYARKAIIALGANLYDEVRKK